MDVWFQLVFTDTVNIPGGEDGALPEATEGESLVVVESTHWWTHWVRTDRHSWAILHT